MPSLPAYLLCSWYSTGAAGPPNTAGVGGVVAAIITAPNVTQDYKMSTYLSGWDGSLGLGGQIIPGQNGQNRSAVVDFGAIAAGGESVFWVRQHGGAAACARCLSAELKHAIAIVMQPDCSRRP